MTRGKKARKRVVRRKTMTNDEKALEFIKTPHSGITGSSKARAPRGGKRGSARASPRRKSSLSDVEESGKTTPRRRRSSISPASTPRPGSTPREASPRGSTPGSPSPRDSPLGSPRGDQRRGSLSPKDVPSRTGSGQSSGRSSPMIPNVDSSVTPRLLSPTLMVEVVGGDAGGEGKGTARS